MRANAQPGEPDDDARDRWSSTLARRSRGAGTAGAASNGIERQPTERAAAPVLSCSHDSLRLAALEDGPSSCRRRTELSRSASPFDKRNSTNRGERLNIDSDRPRGSETLEEIGTNHRRRWHAWRLTDCSLLSDRHSLSHWPHGVRTRVARASSSHADGDGG